MGGGSLVAAIPAMAAETTVTVQTPGVAFDYSDGYWDRSHSWHAWENPEAVTTYRTTTKEHYYDYKHDRDQGWHDKEAGWWDHK